MQQKEISSSISDRIITVDQLLKVYDLSLDDWEIEKQIVNTWEVGAKSPTGEIVTTPLFQVKVWLRSKKEIKTLESIKHDFIQELKNISPVVPKKPTLYKGNKGYLLEINVFDLHLGKKSWEEETSHEYSLSKAIELFEQSILNFIEETKHLPIEKFLLPIGNDFFNSDTSYPYNSTTKGTPQEEDARWQKTFREGRKLLVDQITLLSQIAPVEVIMIPGNHDFERNFYLGDSLEGWFHNNANVSINNNPSPRKYFNYGKVLLGFTHGNEEKPNDLPLLMAQEVPNLWANSYFREFHLGHFHFKKEIKYRSTLEYQGVMIKYMGSLSGTDSWHHKKGYVGAQRIAEAYLWDADKGLKSHYFYRE
jgi:hypothetical protein